MRVTDYIAAFVRDDLGVDTVFMVSGGGMMFLSDGLACAKRLKVVCNHHEQASAMAAVGYAKQRNAFGVAMVTTGCGGTNAMTGLLNAWQDSARAVFISGQCKLRQTVRGTGIPLRQFGVQEADIVAAVRPFSKYVAMVTAPEDIAYELERAAYEASSGRPGPVWIDVPMDIQGASIDGMRLRHFKPAIRKPHVASLKRDVRQVAGELKAAERPVLLVGQGVALAGRQDDLAAIAKSLDVPVVTSFLGGNSISGRNKNYLGRIGTKGCRAANVAVANSDYLLVLGCRLSVSTTGHEYGLFARSAQVVVVDVDPGEHAKGTVRIDRLVKADLRDFLPELRASLVKMADRPWLRRCLDVKRRYPIVAGKPQGTGCGVSMYECVAAINSALKRQRNWSVVSDAGSSFYVTTQVVEVDRNQRYVTSGGQAEMGFSLPAAIGVAAAGARKVIAVSGDGSVQMNIQELQTLRHYQHPVKLIVWNNDGYLSIRATQRKFFNGRYIGTDATSGVSFPSFRRLAAAYGLRYVRIGHRKELKQKLGEALSGDDPVVCEVICMRDELVVPSIASVKLPDGRMKSMPPEDMFPFLPWKEFSRLMLVETVPRT